MSNFAKAVLLLILVLAALGIWYAAGPKTNSPSMSMPVSEVPVGVAATVPAGNASDASLDADISSVDAGLSDVDTNSAAVDAGLNDKPVTQTE